MNDMTVTELTGLSLTDFRKIMLKAEGYELDRDILAQNINLYYIFIFVAALTIAVEFSGGKVKILYLLLLAETNILLQKLFL